MSDADFEQLIHFLTEPSWRIGSVYAVSQNLVRPETVPLVAKVPRHHSGILEIEFSDPDDPPYRRHLVVEGASGGGRTDNPNQWEIKSARRILWDGEEIPGVASCRSAVLIFGRLRMP